MFHLCMENIKRGDVRENIPLWQEPGWAQSPSPVGSGNPSIEEEDYK